MKVIRTIVSVSRPPQLNQKELEFFERACRAIADMRSSSQVVATFQIFLVRSTSPTDLEILEQAKRAYSVTKQEFSRWRARYKRNTPRSLRVSRASQPQKEPRT